MPCDTISTSTIEFSLLATDFALLKLAMQSLGYSAPEISSSGDLSFYKGREVARFVNGIMAITYLGRPTADPEKYINPIKKAYSQQVVKTVSTRFGWKLKEISSNKYEVQKGY